MVYSNTVGRTQVYLGDEELELLDRVGKATGATRSELIRRAVRNTFGELTKTERLQALLASAGTLKDHSMSGAAYVESRRRDLNVRLVDQRVDNE